MVVDSYTGVKDVVETMLGLIGRPREESVSVESALGRVAAEDIRATHDSPETSLTHMDGFAVSSRDLKGAESGSPVRLQLKGDVRPGAAAPPRLGRGEAARVSTGAPLPDGADSVVPVEEAREAGSSILIEVPIARGSFVYPAGVDFRRGDLLIRKGQVVRPQEVGLLMTLGIDRLRVFMRPVVAVLATGSELSDSKRPPKGKKRNAFGPLFVGMVRAAGCVPLSMGVTSDRGEALSKSLRRSLAKSDVVITIGGTSAGRRDLVASAVSALRPRAFFHGLRMDRGRVAGAAVVGRKPLLMLPGPIQGAMNAFLLLGVPVLDRLRGGGPSNIRVKAKMSSDWVARKKYGGFVKVVYVRLSGEDVMSAEPIVGDTESIAVLNRASGYIVVPEGVTHLSAGDFVDVWMSPGLSFVY